MPKTTNDLTMSDEQSIVKIQAVIEGLLRAMGVQASVEVEDSITKGLIFNITTPDSYILIGRQGTHLHALQTLAHSIVAKQLRDQVWTPFSLDVDDYQRKREWFLRETAKQAVEKATRTGRPVALEPMPNFERKLIHTYLQNTFPEIISDSQGYEPRRYIVVRLNTPRS